MTTTRAWAARVVLFAALLLPAEVVLADEGEPSQVPAAAHEATSAAHEATSADEREARPDDLSARLYGDAAALRDAGDIEGSCAKLYGAVAVEERASWLLELGACFERDGDPTGALAHFARALAAWGEEPPDAALKAEIDGAIARIHATTAELVVVTSAVEEGAWVVYTVDEREVESAWVGGGLRVAPGVHAVHAERPGCARWQGEVECAAAARCQVEVPALSCSEGFAVTRGKLWKNQLAKQRFADNPYSRAGIWLGGAGAVVVIVGIVQLRQSGSDWDRARSLGCNSSGVCPNGYGDEFFEDSRRKKGYAIASFVVGGLALSGAASLVLYGRKQMQARDRRSEVVVVPLLGDELGALVSVGGVY